MLIGRFFLIIPVLAIAGSLAPQAEGPGDRRHVADRTRRCSAACWLGVVVIVVGLTYFPALALGPIVEHLSL